MFDETFKVNLFFQWLIFSRNIFNLKKIPFSRLSYLLVLSLLTMTETYYKYYILIGFTILDMMYTLYSYRKMIKIVYQIVYKMMESIK